MSEKLTIEIYEETVVLFEGTPKQRKMFRMIAISKGFFIEENNERIFIRGDYRQLYSMILELSKNYDMEII